MHYRQSSWHQFHEISWTLLHLGHRIFNYFQTNAFTNKNHPEHSQAIGLLSSMIAFITPYNQSQLPAPIKKDEIIAFISSLYINLQQLKKEVTVATTQCAERSTDASNYPSGGASKCL